MLASAYQAVQFLLMLQCGICIGFIYSLFLPLRLIGAKHRLIFIAADFIFGLIAGAVFVLFLLLSSSGELYFYSLLSVFCGFLLQYAAVRPIIRWITLRWVKHKKKGASDAAV